MLAIVSTRLDLAGWGLVVGVVGWWVVPVVWCDLVHVDARLVLCLRWGHRDSDSRFTPWGFVMLVHSEIVRCLDRGWLEVLREARRRDLRELKRRWLVSHGCPAHRAVVLAGRPMADLRGIVADRRAAVVSVEVGE